MSWMIYGAYGYTGSLVAQLAATRGELPVLAGRDEERLAALGEQLGLEHRAFALSDPAAVRSGLDGIGTVAHCAGPFSSTAPPMVEACLASGTHYLDVTGEIDVFEHVLGLDKEANAAGVTLLPGSGFDVVPSDCLAAMLAHALPGAKSLTLAIRMSGGASPGTAKTMVESLGTPGRARVGGAIVPVPAQLRRRSVPFTSGAAEALAIAWGDVSTAYHSTGIADITVYATLPRGAAPLVGMLTLAGPVVRSRLFQAPLRAFAGRVRGPSSEARSKSHGEVWGEVVASDGTRACGAITTPNGYDLTADSVVRIATRLEAGEIQSGAMTPSRALGTDFVRELDGVAVHRT
jgi:saccharopine dehydrogenase (NAD+, L-lysine-forming)